MSEPTTERTTEDSCETCGEDLMVPITYGFACGCVQEKVKRPHIILIDEMINLVTLKAHFLDFPSHHLALKNIVAEVERLREALKPFTHMLKFSGCHHTVRCGKCDICRAGAALEKPSP